VIPTWLVVAAILVGCGLMAWPYTPAARRRSAAWRERKIAQHGFRGYRRRSLAWKITPLVLAALAIVVLQLLHP
jgi:hypothetical protein